MKICCLLSAVGPWSVHCFALSAIRATGGTAKVIDEISVGHNEMAKFRNRSGNQWNTGGTTLRMPSGAVGHGGMYSIS